MKVSGRTWGILAAGVASTLLVYAGMTYALQTGHPWWGAAISNIGGIVVIAAAGIFVVLTALRWAPGEPVRRYWMLIGVAPLVYAVGDLAWTWYETVQRVEVPYPGLPDVFYLLMYVFLGAGVISAAVAYRRLVDMRVPLAVSVGVSLAALGAIGFTLIAALLADAEVSVFEKSVSAFYPVADVLLALAPAVVLVTVALRLGRGALARPWFAVALGAVLIAASDTGYSWLQTFSEYESGGIVDNGWMLGFVLIAVGASLARDVYES